MRKSVTALAMTAAIAASSAAAWAENTATDPAAPRPGMPRVDDKGADMKGADMKGADMADPGERPENYKADNSGRNQRDADGTTVQPTDQSNSKADLEITQAIRKAVTSDESISLNGRNVKIVTTGGVVTLRGPVEDESEKNDIASKAKSVAGVARVDNQLEVTAQ
jgi:hyperosmotically inducible periplasmic protein